jgi:hypothetical protein
MNGTTSLAAVDSNLALGPMCTYLRNAHLSHPKVADYETGYQIPDGQNQESRDNRFHFRSTIAPLLLQRINSREGTVTRHFVPRLVLVRVRSQWMSMS